MVPAQEFFIAWPWRKDDTHNSRMFRGFLPTMETPVVTIRAIGPSGPSALCEAPSGLSLSSQRVRLKLSTSTQGSMLQS